MIEKIMNLCKKVAKDNKVESVRFTIRMTDGTAKNYDSVYDEE